VLTFERSNVVVAAESMMARIGGEARTSVGRLEQHAR